jgi:NDP-sugar pyrophosphorylase family protein
MNIIIPLTGNGSRFIESGYKKLKPFIRVLGAPVIRWVVKMFPGDENKIIFICRQKHLDELDYMKRELKEAAPNARIYAIDDWEKKGPVVDVLRAEKYLDDDKPVLINYCDYYMHWDYMKFKQDVLQNECDGAVPCYTGFHPHLIPKKNLYACCRIDDQNRLLEIREKHCFTDDKTVSNHSPGVYYFRSGKIFKTYAEKMVKENIQIKGEYYVSLMYRLMIADGLYVHVPTDVRHFCQWGTPEDMQDSLFWIESVKSSRQ